MERKKTHDERHVLHFLLVICIAKSVGMETKNMNETRQQLMKFTYDRMRVSLVASTATEASQNILHCKFPIPKPAFGQSFARPMVLGLPPEDMGVLEETNHLFQMPDWFE